MSHYRNSCSLHTGAYIQRGRGVGGTFWSLYSKLVPKLKTGASIILESPITQNILETARDSAVDIGVKIAADTLSGVKFNKAVKRNLSIAKNEIAETLASAIKKKKVSKKRAPISRDIFFDDSSDLSD